MTNETIYPPTWMDFLELYEFMDDEGLYMIPSQRVVQMMNHYVSKSRVMKYANWVKKPDGGEYDFYCSNCGQSEYGAPNFCKYCGAGMGGIIDAN